MQSVALGGTGERVSALCLGTMMFGERCDEAEAARIVDLALDRGVNFLDTAAMYGEGLTETILGRVLKGRRARVFLATKVHKGVDGPSILSSLDESLARLQTDYVDLYLIHWPREGMRPLEVMAALDQVVRAGKARYVGCCNYPAWLVAHSNALAERQGWARLICNQVPYNLVERGIEVEILPQAVAEQIAITAYRPLLIGLLAGKYRPGQALPLAARATTDPRIGAWLAKYGDALCAFEQYATELGVPPAALAIAWVAQTPGVTAPIVGASAASQLESALRAGEVRLTPAQWQDLAALFACEVKEEAGGKFPALRRLVGLTG